MDREGWWNYERTLFHLPRGPWAPGGTSPPGRDCPRGGGGPFSKDFENKFSECHLGRSGSLYLYYYYRAVYKSFFDEKIASLLRGRNSQKQHSSRNNEILPPHLSIHSTKTRRSLYSPYSLVLPPQEDPCRQCTKKVCRSAENMQAKTLVLRTERIKYSSRVFHPKVFFFPALGGNAARIS